jgi:Na+-translocating ferredoxin:NAD+ oxidoreductase subunit G
MNRFIMVVAMAVLGAASPADADAPRTTADVLRVYFADCTRVTFVTAKLPASSQGTARELPVYIGVRTGAAGEEVAGYAVVDDEIGQHEPITLAMRAGADGLIGHVDVLTYREAYGHEIQSPRYMNAWVGRSLADLQKKPHQVEAISGATLSSRSTERFLLRALQVIAWARTQPVPAPASRKS